jgi:hypothetical protein
VSQADRPADETSDVADDAAVAEGAVRTAERLLRWYPRPWRDRYGAEFTELLISDISERPQSLRRSLDVARGGVRARLADAGLAGFPPPVATAGAPAGMVAEQARQHQISASLGSFSCALGAFLVFAAALSSEIIITSQQSAWLRAHISPARLPPLAQPRAHGAFFASFTTDAMLALLALAVLAALPVLGAVVARVARDRTARLIRPSIALAASLSVLFVGGRHFENDWVGTGGHHALIPSGLAAFIWAVTLFVSSYWGHPAMFATLPADQRVWMALSPFVLALAVASATVLVRRARLPPRVAAFEACLGLLACAIMAAFVACYGVWITERARLEPGMPLGLSIGATNATIIAFLALALAVAAQAARMAVRGVRRARG